jgi:TolB-like protein
MPSGGQAAPHKVLILPFNVYAPPELAYLEDGILATLSNRFQGFATPIVPTEAMKKALENLGSPYTSDTAQTVGASLGATHAVTGSVTIVGDAVSTDIQLWRLPEGAALTTFHAGGNRPDAVLAHLDDFILQVESTVFGQGPPSAAGPAPLPSPTSGAAPLEPPPVSWQSQPLDAHVTGISVADLDAASGTEIAVIDDQDLWICQRVEKSLLEVQRFEGAPYLRLIAVDAADINGDGLAEVFVSAFHTRLGQPRSFVVEWHREKQQYTKRFENLATYFRITASPAGGLRLVGQESGFDDFFGGQPAFMRWQEGQYAVDTHLALPTDINIYDFVQGPFLPGETDAVVTLSRQKRLELYDVASQRHWRSDASYGGGSVYLDESETSQNRSKQLKRVGEETIKRHYLHPRMLMEDIDGDKASELLVVHNTDATKGVFRRSRLLTSGRVVCLAWKPLGAVAKWQTPKVSGHINDMAVGDSDGDGGPELIYVVVTKAKKGLDRHQSYLVSHALATAR